MEFRVADTGVGIPPEAQAVIFEPFRQVDVGRGPMRGGAGLGLYIVKQLLAVLGGTIAVESEVGSGSTFRVWLPLVAPAEPRHARRDAGRTGRGCRTRRHAAQNGRLRRPDLPATVAIARWAAARTPTTAAAGAARGPLACFADLERAAVERLPVEGGDRLLGVLG